MQHPISNIKFQCMDNPTTLHHHQTMPAQLEDILAVTNSSKDSKPYTQIEEKVRTQQEEAPPSLKCPRCDSTNTKFCYYNNYSLSQPRYFCKSCKRYWTQGGSIRKIPVGGSCKKKSNKKSSSTKKNQDQSISTPNYNPVHSLTSVSNDVTLPFSRQLPITTGEHIFGLGPDIEPMSTVFGSFANIQFDTLRSSTSTPTSSTNNSNSNTTNTLLFEALKSGFLETQSGNHDFYGNERVGEFENGMLPYIQMNGTKEIAATTTTATVTTITRKQELWTDVDGENNTLFGNFPWQGNEESNMSSVVGSGKELYSNGGLGSSWYGLINSL